MKRIRNRYLLLVDAVLLAIAPFFMYAARYEGWTWPDAARTTAIRYTLASVPLCLAIFLVFGVYRRLWRYASTAEIRLIFLSGTTAAAACALLGGIILPASGLTPLRVPLSVLATNLFLVIGIAATPRLSVRVGVWRRDRRKEHRKRVLVAGAGVSGQMIIRELMSNLDLGFEPVGVVDDDTFKHGHRLANVPVLGTLSDIPSIASRFQIDLIIIAMPSAGGAVIRKVVRAALDAGVETRTVPGLSEIISGQVRVGGLREVQIQDLLRREPIETDLGVVSKLVADRVVLITGAGGSIGSELCRQVAKLGPTRLLLLGHGENSIFEVLQELKTNFPSVPIEPLIADIRDSARIDRLMAEYCPYIIFHAAAHKHVPLMEENVIEAVTNNVIGTRNMVDAAVRCGTEHFVLISTDKAVRPTNIMGATKRVAEHIVRTAAMEHERNFVAVRFGNVLGSRGSVVPTFMRQIRDGGPVTVTHPDVRRYFMTIPEAVQLVLQSAAVGQGAELFMLDMGELVPVVDLARDMIRLSGLEEGQDIEIRFTGLRPGEKLSEEMVYNHETVEPTHHPKVLRAKNGDHVVDGGSIEELIAMANACASDVELRRQLERIVPDFEPRSNGHGPFDATKQLVDALQGAQNNGGGLHHDPRVARQVPLTNVAKL